LDSASPDPEAQARLRERLKDMRGRVSHLVGQIAKDIPELTVHDITHLDALWETASLVAGPEYPLNPAEGFVLGAAFLLHDSAMCIAAYPGGLKQIKELPQWNDAIAYHLRATNQLTSADSIQNPPPELTRAALADVLREVHAQRASDLPHAEWPTPDGRREMLIQDSTLLATYGEIIGAIAASHWWPINDLVKLPPRVNAGEGIPGEWHINPRKIACLLRVADAAHIDHRRAPRFLQALVQPTGVSAVHWDFQRRLGKPSVERNSLLYTGNPFDIENADAWWLCYDMLGMIDDELRGVRGFMDTHDIEPLLISGVKGAKSPEAVAVHIPTRRWRPVNTELRVSDVPALVKLLGGERLYGNDSMVPIRELIQNAADAIRARRLLEDLNLAVGRVLIQHRKDSEGRDWIDVEDDGIGMSAAVLTGSLLDFGKSFWESAAMRREFPGLQSKGIKAVGRFGIGFFSVFMLGDEVTVTSRRHDAAANDTRTLDFRKGLRMRPILREPLPAELLSSPGTRVSVRLRVPVDQPNGLLYGGSTGGKVHLNDLALLVARHAPAVDVTVCIRTGEQMQKAVAANDWLISEPAELLRRTASETPEADRTTPYASLRELKEPTTGEQYGRACVFPATYYWRPFEGVVTVGGFFATRLQNIAGILLGEPRTVARNSALPTVPASILRNWATEQAGLIAASKLSGEQKLRAAQIIMVLGGLATDLPIVCRNDEYLTAEQLVKLLRAEVEVEVYMGDELDYDEDDDVRPKDFSADLVVSESLVFVPDRQPSILDLGSTKWPQCIPELYLLDRPKNCEEAFHLALKHAWAGDPEYDEDSRKVGTVHHEKIFRQVRIYTVPVDVSTYLKDIDQT